MVAVRLTQQRWAFIALLGFSVCGGVGILALISQNYVAANESSVRAKNAILALAELEGSLKDAETGQRGFLLTGDDDYLDPYLLGTAIAQANLIKLDRLIKSSDAVSTRNLEEIKYFTKLKLDELEETIALRRSGGLPSVIPLVLEGKGKAYMDAIKTRANRIRFTQETLLSTNNAIYDQLDATRNSVFVLITSASGGIFWLLWNSFKEEINLRKQIQTTQACELQLQEAAVQRLKEAAELKERELSLRIHDWKNPVTSIQSSADLIRYYYSKQQLNEENFNKHYTRIMESVTTMLNGFDDALLVARAEAGKLDISRNKCDLIAVCQQSIASVDSKLISHTLRLYVTDMAYPVEIDANLVRRAIVNLLENAIKHTTTGEIAICLYRGANKTCIQVADQGEGIPPEDLQRLFSAFERGHTEAKGTGLGLAVVRYCADAHGGTVRVDSKAGLKLAHPDALTYSTIFTLCL